MSAQPRAWFERVFCMNEQSSRPFAPEMRATRFPAAQYLLHLGKNWQFGAHEPRLKILSGVPD